MDSLSKLRAGVLGAAGRGQNFLGALINFKETELAAVCDVNKEKLNTVCDKYNVPLKVRRYLSYEEMLEKEHLDVLVVSTPIDMHYTHIKPALERNIHVLGEVPAVFSINEARKLVELCKRSKATYMMAENANYFKFNLIVKEMVQDGCFGEVYYIEAEYLHNTRLLTKQYTPWRYKCIYGKNGIPYGTHSLGPVLSWLEDDRVSSISCMGSDHHFRDTEGNPFELEDTCTMMCKTEKGRLIKIRIDFTSPRPSINRYQLQGTKGAFESQYHERDYSKVFIADDYFENEIDYYERINNHPEYEQWKDITEYQDKYFLPKYKEVEQIAKSQGHDGADYFMMVDYIDALYNGRNLPIDLHRSLNITLPGLMSEQSVNNGGEWVEVPDSTKW